MRRFLRMGAAVATLCCGSGALAQAGPVPIDPASWVTNDDYPADALGKGEKGPVKFALSVDPHGRPTGCRIVESSGSASLDQTTCRVMLARGNFRPATDQAGKAIAGLWEHGVKWQSPTEAGTMRMALTPYAQIERVTFDKDGHIVDCTTRKVGDLGYQMEGCLKIGNEYFLGRVLGDRFRSGVLTMTATMQIDGMPLPADAPTTDLPPFWTVDRTFIVQSDGSISDCAQRESGKGIIPCEAQQSYTALPNGGARRVTSETRWSFQPTK